MYGGYVLYIPFNFKDECDNGYTFKRLLSFILPDNIELVL